MGKPETLATRRGNQEWASQRHWQHEGAIKNGQVRDTGNTKEQSRMGKPETLATRRGNQEWASQRHWQHEGAIKNGQARDTGNTKGQSRMGKPETQTTRRGNQEWASQRHWQHWAHKTQDEEKQNTKTHHKKDELNGPHQ
jgi:hypothetical protein